MAELAKLVDFDWTELRGRCVAGEHLGATASLFASNERDARGAPVAYAAQFDVCSVHVPNVVNCDSGCLTHEAWVFPGELWALDAGQTVPKPVATVVASEAL